MVLMFQEFNFLIVVKPRRLNASIDHLSRLENGEEPNNLDDNIPNAKLFTVKMVDVYYEEIVHFLSTGSEPKEFSKTQKK